MNIKVLKPFYCGGIVKNKGDELTIGEDVTKTEAIGLIQNGLAERVAETKGKGKKDE